MRRGARLFAALLCLALLCGCWDYRGLDELTIVAGVAIDESAEIPGNYSVTMEIVDTSTIGEEGQASSRLVRAEGETIFEAVHNANNQLYQDLYFGNMDIMLISSRLASTRGINPIFDAFLRDFGSRDNLTVLISSEQSAGEILESDGESIVSYQISDSIRQNKHSLNTNRPTPLYELYNLLCANTESLALPSIHFQNKEKKELAMSGMAMFRKDIMIGYLSDEVTPLYMLVNEDITDGTFTFNTAKEGEEEALVTVTILKSRHRWEFDRDGSELAATLHLDLTTRAIEISPHIRSLTAADISTLEEKGAAEVRHKVASMIQSVQMGSGADIFQMGDQLYRKAPELWSDFGSDWPGSFRKARVSVVCGFIINDTGLISEYKR